MLITHHTNDSRQEERAANVEHEWPSAVHQWGKLLLSTQGKQAAGRHSAQEAQASSSYNRHSQVEGHSQVKSHRQAEGHNQVKGYSQAKSRGEVKSHSQAHGHS